MMPKYILLIPAVFLLSLTCAISNIGAFSCESKFISEGMYKDEVFERCGDPASVDTWQEEVSSKENNVRVRIWINKERWVYNFGPTHFQQILTFQNGRLITIRSGKMGY